MRGEDSSSSLGNAKLVDNRILKSKKIPLRGEGMPAAPLLRCRGTEPGARNRDPPPDEHPRTAALGS